MTPVAKEWFPPNCLAGEAVRAAAAAAVAPWAARWFGRGGVDVERVESGVARLGGSRSVVGHIAADLGANGAELIIDHALARGPADALAEADKVPLDKFVARAVDDLVVEFSRYLGLAAMPASLEDRRAAAIVVGDANGRALLMLSLSPPAAKALIARSVTGPRSVQLPLIPISAALKTAPVEVEIRLGHMRLTTGSVRDLAIGDVIVLDREIRHGFDLAITGARRSIGRVDFEGGDNDALIRFKHAV